MPRQGKLRRKILVGLCATVVTLAVAWIVISFVEARKEIEILCGLFDEGAPVERVVRVLNTGEFLRYEVVESGGGQTIVVKSPYDLGTRKCTVRLSDGRVVSSEYRATRARGR